LSFGTCWYLVPPVISLLDSFWGFVLLFFVLFYIYIYIFLLAFEIMFWTPVALLLGTVCAARIRVDVGSSGAPALTYTPNSTTAEVGDTLDFHFIDENVVSSVVKGVGNEPCVPALNSTGFFNSGFILGESTGVGCWILCFPPVLHAFGRSSL